MNDFEGKVVLVTGSTGIGLGTALRLAQGGAHVVSLGIDEAGNQGLARDAATAGLDLVAQRVDVSEPTEVEAAINGIEDRFGGLDIIVNSAAIRPYGDAVATTPETFCSVSRSMWGRST